MENRVVKEYSGAEVSQEQHYDTVASEYSNQTNDAVSQMYRMKFINEPLLEDLDLSGKKVLDAMCGSGQTTGYLLEQGAQVTGLDISGKQIELLQQRYPDCDAQCASILSTGLESNSFDCVVVVGGLHHLHPDVSKAVNEIYRVLKVGGHFCFVECHKGSFPNLIRRLWYKWDSFFLENEAAIDFSELELEFASKFKFIKKNYKGNVAYLLVGASWAFRIPMPLKSIYSPPLFVLESIVEKIQGKRSSCMVICQWKKV